jgi:WD40 repeat protein
MKATIQEEAELMVTRFNHEDTMAACGYSDGYVRVFNLGTDNKIAEINAGTKEPGPVNTLRWRPINELNSSTTAVLLVANTNGHIYQYAAKTGKEIFHTFEEGNYIMAMDYDPAGRSFCTGGKDNLIRIYD